MLTLWLLTVKISRASLAKDGPAKREIGKEDIDAIVVRGSLSDGIRLVSKYEQALNVRFAGSSTTMLRLIAASRIPDDTDMEALMRVGVLELAEATIEEMVTRKP